MGNNVKLSLHLKWRLQAFKAEHLDFLEIPQMKYRLPRDPSNEIQACYKASLPKLPECLSSPLLSLWRKNLLLLALNTLYNEIPIPFAY